MQQQKARKAAEQKAIVDQMQARQKASEKFLSETKGYDVSKLMPQARPLFEEYVNEKMQEIYNFSIDDPVKARGAVNDIANFFNTYSSHYTDESKTAKELHFGIGNDESEAAKYDESLAVYMQSAATPQTAIEAQQIYDGRDIVLRREGGKIFFTNVDPATGESMGEEAELTTWDQWQNPAVFQIPTQARYGVGPAQIGAGKVYDSISKKSPDTWSREMATKESRALIAAGSVDKDANSVRAWGVENLFDESYRNDEDLFTAYITADVNNPLYVQNKDYLATIDGELVDIMVEHSKYPPKEEDESKLSSGERDERNYLRNDAKRETVNSVEGLAIDVKDPTRETLIASEAFERFGARMSNIAGTAEVYTLPKGLTLTNVDNPLFGVTDEFNNVIDAGVNQIIEIEDVRSLCLSPQAKNFLRA